MNITKHKCAFAALAALTLAIAAFAESTVTPRYYVGDSLVAMYDAICNATNAAGAFVHDNAATKWIDLSGNGRDFTVESGGSWTDTTFEFNDLSATLSPAVPYYYTQEVRFEQDSGRWVFFGSNDGAYVMQGVVSVNGSPKKFQTAFDTSGNSNRSWLDASSFTMPFTTTVTYKDLGSGSLANYCNATAASYTGKNRWATSVDASAIGARPDGTGYTGKGRIQSIRLYSRVLSADEIARNYLVDQVRFEGAALPEPLEPTVSCAQAAGVGDAGGALVRVTASSFGWLGSRLVSAAVECSSTADFASPVSFPVVLTPSGASGVATISGFAPGATVYARAVAENDLGASAISAATSVTVLSSDSGAPAATLDSAAAVSAVAAVLSVSVDFIPSGRSCDLRAVVSDGGATWTNLVASGITSAGAYDCPLAHLAGGTAYTVSILASAGAAAAPATPSVSFSTPAQALPPSAYVQDGLILHLDAICNSLDGSGRPVHSAAPTTWTDLAGNHALVLGGSGAASIAFNDASVVFPASEAYVLADDAADVSDAVLDGTFTVEAAFKLDRNANSDQWAAYSIGSGSYNAPRTLCFDLRLSNGKRGCIQYNANAWKNVNNYLTAYSGNDSTIPATYTVAGGGSVGSDALVYHDGDYLQTIKNCGDYTSASDIDKKIRVRHYSSAYTQTDYYAFRAYGRSLSTAEIATNATVDAVRFFGAEPPAPIEPSVSFIAVDTGTAGEISLLWTVETCGWPSASLPTLAVEYSVSPDFVDAAVVSLGTDVAAGTGSATLSGLVPGQRYHARCQPVNGVGVAGASASFAFTASTGEAAPPAFSAGAVSPGSASASFPFMLTGDGGGACDGYAILEHGGRVSTNALFSGATAPHSATLALSPLAPDAAYTATVCVTNGAGLAAEPAVLSFRTLPDATFVNLYATNGLVALFDGICNATNAAGVPVHSDAPGGWTDLMGNFATVDFGSVAYLPTGVVYAASIGAYTWCEDGTRAVNAILAGTFTVEALCGFDQTAGSGDYWGLYSFGSGSSDSPRLLTFDTRWQNINGTLKSGAVHYNLSGWDNGVMMSTSADFSRMGTYTVAGGGAGASGSLYVDGAYQRTVPNGTTYTTSSSVAKHFAIRRYSGLEERALYHSFRIYDRNLSADEIAHNRAVDEARFFGAGTLSVAAATRDGDSLLVTLVRTGATDAAPVALHWCADYGDWQTASTSAAFAENSDTAAATVAVPAGAVYVRFSAGALLSEPILLSDAGAVDGVSVGAASVSGVTATSATVSASVVVPASSDPVTLWAAYGLAPDALVSTNALSGASATVAASGVASGALSGLVPNRTYYLRVFGVAGGETFDSPADAIAVFTTPDGEGGAKIVGDVVTVTGHESGDVLTFSGTSDGAVSVTVNGHAAAIAGDGTWSVTFSDVAPGVATGYLVQARDASGTLDALPVFAETTRAASALPASVRGTVSQRALSVSSALAVQGANATTVRLLTGPSADALTNTLSTVVAAGDAPSFAFAWSAPTFGETVFWAVEIENAATDPANGHWVSRSGVASFTTIDEAKYTWRDVDGDWTGNWSDPAHWADDKGGDCLGWPCTTNATARIERGTVALDVSATIGWIEFGTNGTVTIEGPGTLDFPSKNYEAQWLLVPDGADVILANGATMDLKKGSLALSATSRSQTNYAARVTVTDGAHLAMQAFVMSYGGVFVLDDATARLWGVYFGHGASATGRNGFPATGGTLRLAGEAPLLTLTENLRYYNTAGVTAGGAIEFSVPRGGFAATPLAMTGTGSGQTFCGDANVADRSVPIQVRVAADSPVYRSGRTIDVELATWRVVHTDGASLVSLQPVKFADQDPEHRRLYLAADDLSLRLLYRCGGTIILVR